MFDRETQRGLQKGNHTVIQNLQSLTNLLKQTQIYSGGSPHRPHQRCNQAKQHDNRAKGELVHDNIVLGGKLISLINCNLQTHRSN